MWGGFYKFFLLLFNFIFVISSVIVLSVGLIIRGQYLKYQEFLNEHYFTLPFMLICVSCIMIAITFFGCCGALQDNSCMISIFAFMLGVLFIMEAMLGFAGYALSEKTHVVLKTSLNETMQLYNKSDQLTKVWDGLQVNLRCCGVDSYRDWYPVLNNSIPMSCCVPRPGAVGREICDESVPTLHRSSCLDVLGKIVKENASTIGAVGIGIALAQVLGVFFSCALARRMQDNYENFE